MRVEVRAVILLDGKVVTTVETRHGEPHTALPGGRVERWETLEEALVREVREETDLLVSIGRLLYVAQVVSRYALQDVNFVYAATVLEVGDGTFQLIDLDAGTHVLPPILDRIAADASSDWPDAPYWLGNIFDDDLTVLTGGKSARPSDRPE
jgi:ADP-ribose pyrophosphatase YjhB (NUDIX family)